MRTLEELTEQDKPFIIQCCVCRRYEIDKFNKTYIKVEDPVARVIETGYNISHSYCPKCYDTELKRALEEKE